MRLGYSASALWALLRRWSGFVLVFAAVLGEYAPKALGWPALPLFWAVAQPAPLLLLGVLGHALIATALSWALREALLPRAWLEAERALPLPTGESWKADATVVALAQGPLVLLYLVSWLNWGLVRPAWMQGLWLGSALALTASLATGLLLGVLLLRWRRRPGRRVWGAETRYAGRAPRVWAALLLLPMARGPARSLGLWLLACGSALLLCMRQAWAAPEQLRWWLAAYAFAGMLGSARAFALARRDLAALRLASVQLPLAQSAWPHAERLLALSPCLLVWPLLVAMLLLGPWTLAPLAGPGLLLAALLMPVFNLYLPEDSSAEARAARWLLFLTVWIVLGTECLAL
ncbi:hypothetical protein [Pelomonas sp. SE-A7]|uniref:hypothetical protein n=1 Tax=Pelomonas sp. SE-A7 TaxID=3054953 RepID=UPI00259C9E0F|nr:hypothetical protein [Pelomonas sp. SE-A7]MDM4768401.1 hypothetical protein [Pelomonas sp. SE-A7]